MFIDTHCHLDFPEYDQDRDKVIKRAKENGVDYIINIGSSLDGSHRAVSLAKQYDSVYATVGIHPHEADTFSENQLTELRGLAEAKKVVAIGEIGLDFYKNYSSVQNQGLLFGSLLGLAKELELPLVIHSRQAQAETLQALSSILPHKVVIHCFSGNEDFLKSCLELGIFVSFTCNITYKKAEGLRRLVALAPLEKIFLETDAPFLAPEGRRGTRNEPKFVEELALEIARIKKVSMVEVAKATTENAKGFFNLK
jgi:TatD DNase family protein